MGKKKVCCRHAPLIVVTCVVPLVVGGCVCVYAVRNHSRISWELSDPMYSRGVCLVSVLCHVTEYVGSASEDLTAFAFIPSSKVAIPWRCK